MPELKLQCKRQPIHLRFDDSASQTVSSNIAEKMVKKNYSRIITNSSPPRRATVSLSHIFARRRSAAWCSIMLPHSCSHVSLTAFKLSRSMYSRALARCRRHLCPPFAEARRVIALGWQLLQIVVVGKWAVLNSAALRSLTSVSIARIALGRPRRCAQASSGFLSSTKYRRHAASCAYLATPLLQDFSARPPGTKRGRCYEAFRLMHLGRDHMSAALSSANWPLRIMCMSSIPASTLRAERNDLKFSFGRGTHKGSVALANAGGLAG
jgi:hypothetical protein